MNSRISLTILGILLSINIFVKGATSATQECLIAYVYLGDGGISHFAIIDDTGVSTSLPATNIPKSCNSGYQLAVNCINKVFIETTFTLTLSIGKTPVNTFICTDCCTTINTIINSGTLLSPLDPNTNYDLGVQTPELSSTFMTGDPHIIGLLDQHFDFQGTCNKIYNLFSDNHISVNGLFSKYTSRTNIISVISVIFDNHSIIVFANQTENNSTSRNFLFDNEIITLLNNQVVNLTSCVYISWFKNEYFSIATLAHEIRIYPEISHNINYLNFELILDVLEETVVGGIIGQTNTKNFTVKSLIESDFIEDTLSSSISLKNKFINKDICNLPLPVNPKKVSVNHQLTCNSNFVVSN